MTAEESKLIDQYEVLFSQSGWKELVSDLSSKRLQMAQNLVDSRSDQDQVNFTRGVAAGYQYVIGLEEYIRAYKENTNLPDVDYGA